MNTATIGKIARPTAAPEIRISLHDILTALFPASVRAADADEHLGNLDIEKRARDNRREYLRTQRSFAGY